VVEKAKGWVMSFEDRLDRIERRLAALETIVREMVGARGARPPTGPEPVSPREAEPRPATRSPASQAPPRETVRAVSALRAAPFRSNLRRAEQWIGQRGLLAVGVALLILAAGYLLKLAFDRGWISPAMRCLGAAVAGLAVGSLGWRAYRRGLEMYGAALIGAGAAIVYLALWAAARLYALVPTGFGIAGLAVVSFTLAAVAYRIDVQALGAAAALGALFAPIVVGSDAANANVLLIYLGIVGMTLGFVAVLRGWRLTTALIALTYFGLALGVASDAAPGGVLAYALVGGTVGLGLGLSAGWAETRLLAFTGGWALLTGIIGRMGTDWPVAVGGVVLAAPIWLRALRSPTIWPDAAVVESRKRWSLGETLYFYTTPLLVGVTVEPLVSQGFGRYGGAVALLVAVPYLVAGFTKIRVTFALAGTTALAIAVLTQWDGLAAVWGLLGLTLAWATLDHLLQRTDGRWYALLALGAAFVHLVDHDLVNRGPGPGFGDLWAVSLWLMIAVIVVLAAGLWQSASADVDSPRPESTLPLRVPAVLWGVTGVLLFGGVTGELYRHIGQLDLSPDIVRLSTGLSVSAWWAVFAGGLVAFGFSRQLRSVRLAGLIVAALAVAKVLIVDLSRLDALYRVASVFILAVVSLLVAYLYHRHARIRESGGEADSTGTRV
jgi:uncharacterized membrane protein